MTQVVHDVDGRPNSARVRVRGGLRCFNWSDGRVVFIGLRNRQRLVHA